jgi:hypothetical protein
MRRHETVGWLLDRGATTTITSSLCLWHYSAGMDALAVCHATEEVLPSTLNRARRPCMPRPTY